MNHQWTPQVSRALHHFSDATPDVPSLRALLEQGGPKQVVVSAPSPLRERPNRSAILVACAAIVAIGIVGVALIGRGSDSGPGPADTVGLTPTVTPSLSDSTTPAPSTTTPEATADGASVLAHAEAIEIAGFGGLNGLTLSIDAVEHDGAVSGEFRAGNVVVTIRCWGTRETIGDLILGGVVTANTDGIATLDDVSVAVGDVLALIVRDDPEPVGQ